MAEVVAGVEDVQVIEGLLTYLDIPPRRQGAKTLFLIRSHHR
jgi:hypothetical protein